MTGVLCVLAGGSAPLSGSVDPSDAVGIGTGTVITNSVTATPTGGAPPYSGFWVQTGGTSLITATAPLNATTQFESTGVTASTVRTASFVYRVTDQIGAYYDIGPVPVQISGNV